MGGHDFTHPIDYYNNYDYIYVYNSPRVVKFTGTFSGIPRPGRSREGPASASNP